MPPAKEPLPALAWLEPAQAPLVRMLAARACLRITAFGGPGFRERAADSPFPDARRESDLRAALASTESGFVLLASRPASDASPDDADLLRLCRARSLTLLTLEPVPASVADAASAEQTHWFETCRFLGLFRQSPALATADELLSSFGPARTLTVAFRSGRGRGTLAARLFDAMHIVHSIMGPPEAIDASVITPVASSGVRMDVGESLRSLHGDLTANLRYAGAKAAAISLSDRAGRWFRGIALIGEDGCIRMDESGVERVDAEGRIVETGAPPPRRRSRKRDPLFEGIDDPAAEEALGDAAARAADSRAPRPAPFDLAAVLAMCEAAVLSARTGQPESPETILRMA